MYSNILLIKSSWWKRLLLNMECMGEGALFWSCNCNPRGHCSNFHVFKISADEALQKEKPWEEGGKGIGVHPERMSPVCVILTYVACLPWGPPQKSNHPRHKLERQREILALCTTVWEATITVKWLRSYPQKVRVVQLETRRINLGFPLIQIELFSNNVFVMYTAH